MPTPLAGRAAGVSFSVPAGRRARQTIIDLDTLDLLPGMVTVLAGPSGSGKSTLLYLLSGLLTPDTGSIRWGDEDLASLSEGRRDHWRHRNAGFVFQNFHLIDELTPLENVLLPAWFSSVSANPHRARAEQLLARFGVPQNREKAALLSRGEQQRVAIARALLFDPQVVFADEPTASLDGVAGQVVAESLRDLAARDGKTVIVASHDPIVQAVADRVVRIVHGKAVQPEEQGQAA